MDFVSGVFIIWVILFIAVSLVSGNRYGQYLLPAFGLAFVFITAPLAGGILVAESLSCYYACSRQKKSTGLFAMVTVSVIFSAFLLFKYLDLKNSVILPLGISYFTFRLIHYVQERYRQRLREHSLTEFMAYMTFFPTYIVGPINLFPEFLVNLRRRQWDSKQFSYGLERIVYGYAQLVILGNYLINHLLNAWISVNVPAAVTFRELSIHSIFMWLDLYVRFSAYSSIAIGISALAGFNVPENFNYPFLASNIREFWQRWHMSLTGWCREYIFAPVAAVSRKPFLAITASMVTIGIWHELSLRYILWGFYHALGIMVYERYSVLTRGLAPENQILLMIRKAAGIIVTLIFVILSFPVTTFINGFIMNLLK